MTKIDRLKEIIAEHPTATNSEYKVLLDSDRRVISMYLSRLKQRGEVVESIEDGQRVLTVVSPPEKTESFKHTVYEAMVDQFLTDFEEAGTYQARLDIAKMIMRLLKYL